MYIFSAEWQPSTPTAKQLECREMEKVVSEKTNDVPHSICVSKTRFPF